MNARGSTACRMICNSTKSIVRCTQFEESFRSRYAHLPHINVGEVIAWRGVEEEAAVHHPGSKIITGTDSQVGLGCVLRGRSASPVLNEELRESIPTLLGGGMPIQIDGALVGAIGVSGGHYRQDEECAKAALGELE